MVSFDVVSLFPNVSIDKTIVILRERYFRNKNDLLDQLNFKDFKKLIEECVKKSHFIFSRKNL